MKKITLWYPPRVRPSFVFVYDDGQIEEGAPLSADEVYCDICNADVIVRPVPVVGSYALCLDCLAKIEPSWQKQVSKAIQRMWHEQILSFLDDQGE